MRPGKQWRPIEHRSPSPFTTCAEIATTGIVFQLPKEKAHVIFVEEAFSQYQTADSWVAHMLLWRCAGCVGVVEEEQEGGERG